MQINIILNYEKSEYWIAEPHYNDGLNSVSKH